MTYWILSLNATLSGHLVFEVFHEKHPQHYHANPHSFVDTQLFISNPELSFIFECNSETAISEKKQQTAGLACVSKI